MNAMIFAAGTLLFPALCTAVGAAGVFLLRRPAEPQTQRVLTGMAAGIMLAASVWSLLLPAIDRAAEGKTVAMLCSGDAGVYGMAGPVLELAEGKDIEIEVVPGVTAALSGAAILGAPLMHDFCVISLSDLLTPWEVIERRLRCAAAGDFSIALYNPRSKKRPDHLRRACEILLEGKSPDTVCGWVKNIGRPGQCHGLATLKELGSLELDMFATVFIGASTTKNVDGRMVTPRGYRT